MSITKMVTNVDLNLQSRTMSFNDDALYSKYTDLNSGDLMLSGDLELFAQYCHFRTIYRNGAIFEIAGSFVASVPGAVYDAAVDTWAINLVSVCYPYSGGQVHNIRFYPGGEFKIMMVTYEDN